jgi:hypothetical protein
MGAVKTLGQAVKAASPKSIKFRESSRGEIGYDNPRDIIDPNAANVRHTNNKSLRVYYVDKVLTGTTSPQTVTITNEITDNNFVTLVYATKRAGKWAVSYRPNDYWGGYEVKIDGTAHTLTVVDIYTSFAVGDTIRFTIFYVG